MSTSVKPKFSTMERIAFRVRLEWWLKEETTTPSTLDKIQENVMTSIPTVGEVSMKELTEMDMTQREEYEMANNLD